MPYHQSGRLSQGRNEEKQPVTARDYVNRIYECEERNILQPLSGPRHINLLSSIKKGEMALRIRWRAGHALQLSLQLWPEPTDGQNTSMYRAYMECAVQNL